MKRFALLLIPVFLASCASNDKNCGPGGSGSATARGGKDASEDPSSGSLWDQLDKAHKQKREHGTSVTESEKGAKALPQGWRQKIDGWWALYQKSDEGWPAAK